MCMPNATIASCSQDGTVQIWTEAKPGDVRLSFPPSVSLSLPSPRLRLSRFPAAWLRSPAGLGSTVAVQAAEQVRSASLAGELVADRQHPGDPAALGTHSCCTQILAIMASLSALAVALCPCRRCRAATTA